MSLRREATYWCVSALVACAPRGAAAQAAPAPRGLTIVVTQLPSGTPAGAAVFVAGTFNAWNPGDSAYRLARRAGGTYALTLPDSVRGPVEFKLTLGSWARVETTAAHGDVPNRAFTIPADGAAVDTCVVAAWRDSTAAPVHSTAGPTVAVLDTAFAMPQLGRTRRVWIYLPPGYARSRQTYPVLYLQDGQNVFDAATSFAGEWRVDETLDSLHALGDSGIIVVAVDHGGAQRLNEYMPWAMAIPRLGSGGGQGAAYVDFLVHTLKPYIDAHFHTRRDRIDTGIGGSSLGGLIALYAALRYPDVFGRVLAFSPSLFVNPEIFALARTARRRRPPTRFYFDSGHEEGASEPGLPDHVFVRSTNAMLDTLAAAGIDTAADVRSLLPADGAHAEWFWSREFPAAYLWLFRRGR